MTALRMNVETVRAAAERQHIPWEQLATHLGCPLEQPGIVLISAVTTKLGLAFADAFTVEYDALETPPWWHEGSALTQGCPP